MDADNKGKKFPLSTASGWNLFYICVVNVLTYAQSILDGCGWHFIRGRSTKREGGKSFVNLTFEFTQRRKTSKVGLISSFDIHYSSTCPRFKCIRGGCKECTPRLRMLLSHPSSVKFFQGCASTPRKSKVTCRGRKDLPIIRQNVTFIVESIERFETFF